ncbi:Phosphomethylpyrimidine kinase-domain-containing protein [Phakopsora pachyrhizi]|uniref:Phosphomethylpyrimidine kinase-domain-containing protein n=1 Tax=Phakopsora pachyrhizi TaxID=170000 RepID=A0AAV0AIL9_PHAPC|nr:Phosphomethylpyrimidine kinase-domain-containing protein [Phakopsora pachyrhizi]CAH7666693.1 Phosphomethylpyrimidine kinase-domain-containing protein [Phakopsora pachyrhizi]
MKTEVEILAVEGVEPRSQAGKQLNLEPDTVQPAAATVSPAKTQTTNVLTIAGSDSGGGAGIQADIKTFTSLEAYGLSVITAITSQNTIGVNGVEAVSASMVFRQLNTVASDIRIDAIKTGMLYSSEIIDNVSKALVELYPDEKSQPILVIDPVMVSTSGHELLQSQAVEDLKRKLFPRSTIVTPNLSEAAWLVGRRNENISSIEDMMSCCRKIAKLGTKNVLLKGGHSTLSEDLITDILYQADIEKFHTFSHPKINSKNTHGTGCTLSAALAVYLSRRMPVFEAVNAAIEYVQGAISAELQVGKGSGPLNHFHNILQRPILRPTLHKKYPFTSALINACGSSWDIFTSDHEFLVGVKNGTLPIKCFQHFLRQDYIFLTHYARIHSLIAFKCEKMDEIEATAKIISHIANESKMHINMCRAWGLADKDFFNTDESNQTIAYTRYVMDIGFSKSLLHLRVATAPCLIGYGEMALRLKQDPLTVREGNPYWSWILNYADEVFQDAVVNGRHLLEQMVVRDVPSSQQISELVKIFSKAVKLEIDFWQMGLDCS